MHKQEVKIVAVEVLVWFGAMVFVLWFLKVLGQQPCWEHWDLRISISLVFFLLLLFLQIQNPAVAVSDSIRKKTKLQNSECFDIVSVLMVPPHPSSFPVFSLKILFVYFFEFTLFKFIAPGIHPNTPPVFLEAQVLNRAR